MIELTLVTIVFILSLAFFCEYVDSTLGMGYGTTMTPLLLIMGYEPLQIVPAVLVSELISGLFAGVLHHREGNVDFKPKIIHIPAIAEELKAILYLKAINNSIPRHLKVALVLAVCSIIGTVTAVFFAVNIPKIFVKYYIGILVLSMGVVILICFNRRFDFSWKKIIGLGLLASFNKGLSGGGYGPVVTSGQVLSGVEGKSAVGITSLAEGLTCAVGIVAYLLMSGGDVSLRLAPFVTAGAVLSVPFSVKSVKKITEKRLKLAIALMTIALGALTLCKIIMGR